MTNNQSTPKSFVETINITQFKIVDLVLHCTAQNRNGKFQFISAKLSEEDFAVCNSWVYKTQGYSPRVIMFNVNGTEMTSRVNRLFLQDGRLGVDHTPMGQR